MKLPRPGGSLPCWLWAVPASAQGSLVSGFFAALRPGLVRAGARRQTSAA
jgi:hypothetical protein